MTTPTSPSSKPLYLRIRDILRERLAEGTWKEGDALPSRRTLAAELGTTPVTLEKAISELVREGLLDVAVGSGTYVRPANAGPADSRGSAAGSRDLLRLGIIFGFETAFVHNAGLAETDLYVGGLLSGVRSALSGRDVAMTFLSVREGAYQALIDGPLDCGIVLAPTLHGVLLMQETAARRPIVVVGASTNYYRGGPPVPCVDSDNVQGATAAVNHLIEQGHERIALLNLSDENANYHDRLRGFLQAHTDAGRTIEPDHLALFPAGLDGDTERIIRDWLDRITTARRMPSAVVACDLPTTLTLLKTLRDYGMDVPEDVSVVGFDDSPLFEHTTPPITAVRQPLFEMGRLATERLLGRFVDGSVLPDESGNQILPMQLILRGSTAAPH